MSLHIPAGALEKFVGLFHRTNARNPQAKPDPIVAGPVEQLVVSKGKLMVVMVNQTVNVDIPEEDQVDEETYLTFLPMLTESLVTILQVPQYSHPIQEAMKRGGIAAYLDEYPVRINPLTTGTGEVEPT